MIKIPRISATSLKGQVDELRKALVDVINQANLEISVINKKIEEVNKNVK